MNNMEASGVEGESHAMKVPAQVVVLAVKVYNIT